MLNQKFLISTYYSESKLFNIDKIRTVRGELHLEVRDLEDLVAGLETRIGNFNEEVKSLEDGIVEKKNVMKEKIGKDEPEIWSRCYRTRLMI